MSPLVSVLLLLTALLQDKPESKAFDPAVHEATKSFAYDEFLLVPVRVHLLRSKEEDALHCRLEEKDVRRVFDKINRIWNKAGLAPMIESIVSEDAVKPEGFNPERLNDFKGARPAKGREPGMVHVYYVHSLPTNGVYMGQFELKERLTDAFLAEYLGGRYERMEGDMVKGSTAVVRMIGN